MEIFGKLAWTFLIIGFCAAITGGTLYGDKPGYERPTNVEKGLFIVLGTCAVGLVVDALAYVWVG